MKMGFVAVLDGLNTSFYYFTSSFLFLLSSIYHTFYSVEHLGQLEINASFTTAHSVSWLKSWRFWRVFLRFMESVVGIPTRPRAARSGVRIMALASRIFVLPTLPDRLWGPKILLISGYQELFPGGKTAGALS